MSTIYTIEIVFSNALINEEIKKRALIAKRLFSEISDRFGEIIEEIRLIEQNGFTRGDRIAFAKKYKRPGCAPLKERMSLETIKMTEQRCRDVLSYPAIAEMDNYDSVIISKFIKNCGEIVGHTYSQKLEQVMPPIFLKPEPGQKRLTPILVKENPTLRKLRSVLNRRFSHSLFADLDYHVTIDGRVCEDKNFQFSEETFAKTKIEILPSRTTSL